MSPIPAGSPGCRGRNCSPQEPTRGAARRTPGAERAGEPRCGSRIGGRRSNRRRCIERRRRAVAATRQILRTKPRTEFAVEIRVNQNDIHLSTSEGRAPAELLHWHHPHMSLRVPGRAFRDQQLERCPILPRRGSRVHDERPNFILPVTLRSATGLHAVRGGERLHSPQVSGTLRIEVNFRAAHVTEIHNQRNLPPGNGNFKVSRRGARGFGFQRGGGGWQRLVVAPGHDRQPAPVLLR